MTGYKNILRSTAPALQSCVVLIVLFVILISVLPANQATMAAYHLHTLEYHVITLAIALPSLLVWLAAFAGYAKLRQYAKAMQETPEGEHFNRLATGTAWLAWSLPLTAITVLVLNAIATKSPGFHATDIIISNYVILLLPLIAFSVIATGSRGLLSDAKLAFSSASIRIIILLFLIVGVLYCYLTFQHFDLGSLSSTNNPYFLPLWLMVLSVTIPYLYAWFIGLLASYEIALFSKQVSGVLYRQALHLVVGGLIAVIVSSIALQYINSIVPRAGYLVLDYRLAITLLFRVIGGFGFIMIAVGAMRLKKIEEV